MGRQRGVGRVEHRPKTAVDMARELPLLFRQLSDQPNILIGEEQDAFAKCEAAIENLKAAFWAAGKALQIIRDARLYRVDYATFEAYCEERWGIHRRYADRLIQAWPVAEILSPIGLKKLTEGQVRELVPVNERHGMDAAVLVYRTVIEDEATPTTAAVLKGAVAALPPGKFDTATAVDHIRAYLAGLGDDEAEPVEPVAALSVEADRIRGIIRRVTRRNVLRDVARQNPDAARRVVAELRELLDQVERDALAPSDGEAAVPAQAAHPADAPA